MKRIILTAFVALLLPSAALAESWKIDPTHSHVGFKVRHFFSKVAGNFSEFSGTIEFDPENLEDAKVEVVIPVASISTDNEKRDNHLQSEDFFYAEEHPEMIFKSTKVTRTEEGFEVEGMLTMRGKENPVVLIADFLGSGPDAWGGTRAGFAASTTIDRQDWDISWNSMLDHGGAVLGDDVEITLEIEAVELAEETE